MAMKIYASVSIQCQTIGIFHRYTPFEIGLKVEMDTWNTFWERERERATEIVANRYEFDAIPIMWWSNESIIYAKFGQIQNGSDKRSHPNTHT